MGSRPAGPPGIRVRSWCVSSKRNQNKKAWAKKRKAAEAKRASASRGSPTRFAAPRPPLKSLRSSPSELDQVGVVIVEEQLPTTDLDGLRRMATRVPFEPCVSLLSMLAGRVETTINDPAQQLALAEEFFGPSELVERYQAVITTDPSAHVFGPQSL